MTTPADELRAAASKLHSLITFLGDNRGPWKVGTPPSGSPQSISNVGVPYCVADTHEDPSIPVFTIAPYIATMHPGVGKELAVWLDAMATWAREYPEMAHDHDRPACQDYACDVMGRGIAFARAINATGCRHSFPDPYPHGSPDQTSGCRHCGTSYQAAKASMSAPAEEA